MDTTASLRFYSPIGDGPARTYLQWELEAFDIMALSSGTLRLATLPDEPSPVYGLAADASGNVLRTTAFTTGTLPVGANPTATVGSVAVNGVATTFVRSDASMPLANPFPVLVTQEFTGDGTNPVLATSQSAGPSGVLPHFTLSSGRTDAPAGGYSVTVGVPSQPTLTTLINANFPLLAAGTYIFAFLEADNVFTGNNVFASSANTSMWSPLISFPGGTAYGIAFDGDIGFDGNVVYLVPPTLPTGLREINVPDADGTMAVSASAPLALDGSGNLTYSGPSGTVTSVGIALPTSVFDISGSPVTGAGTLTATFDNQTANTVFAGPATGAPAAPTFRTLTDADIPNTLTVTDLTVTNVLDVQGTLTNTAGADIAVDNNMFLGNAYNISGVADFGGQSLNVAAGPNTIGSSALDFLTVFATQSNTADVSMEGAVTLGDDAADPITVTGTAAFAERITGSGGATLSIAAGSLLTSLKSTATNDDPTLDLYQQRTTTTNNTVTTILTFPVAASTAYVAQVRVVGRRTGGSAGASGDYGAYERTIAFRNEGGTVTVNGGAGALDVTTIYENQAAWAVQAIQSGTNVLIRVTGATNNNVTWHLVKFEVSPVSS